VLVNAGYHCGYEEREPVEVRVLPDHITITSYPGADRSISLDDLAAGRLVSRRYRNRCIGDFLKDSCSE
jgi:ATP-dependent DNA helicase RecG